MKGYLNTMVRVLFALMLGVVCMNSCSKDDDDEKEKHGSGDYSLVAVDAFHNGMVNNEERNIVVDCRKPSKYSQEHIKGAINIDCESSDEAYFTGNFPICDSLKIKDPKQEKNILLYGEELGTQYYIKMAETLSKAGWKNKKVFILNGKYKDYSDRYSNDIEKSK